jgi:hypothetical protein
LIKGQGHYAQNGLNIVRVGHNFSLKAWIGIIFHRIVTLDPKKYYDFDTRSVVKVTIHIMVKTGK